MKAQDLMLGDLVTFRDCQKDTSPAIIKVWQINADNEAFVSIDGSDGLDEISIDDEIVGIPLTPEILEKNGFEIRGRKKYFLVPNDPSLAIKREPIIGAHGNTFTIGHFWEGKKDFRWFIEISFVHELQHALRLCGIEKEIVL